MKSVIDKYKYGIRKIIYNMTGSKNEDIEQEVYIRTWKNKDKYTESGKFKSYISVITANLCRDFLKSSHNKAMHNAVTEDDELIQIRDEKEGPESILIRKQRQKRITEAIEALKPKFREVIVLYEIEEMSYEDIAAKLKCPVGTVRSRLFNARKELSVSLRDLI